MIDWPRLTLWLSMIMLCLAFWGMVLSAFAETPSCTYTLETKVGEHILTQDCDGVIHVQKFRGMR